MPSERSFTAIAIAVALCAGLLAGARAHLPVVLVESLGITLSQAGLAFAATTIALFVLDPLLLFALGYGWGQRAAVRNQYATFAAAVLLVALVGYAAGQVATVSALTSGEPMATAMSRTALGVTALGFALRATLAAVAGGAVAEFRSSDVRSTSWSEADD